MLGYGGLQAFTYPAGNFFMRSLERLCVIHNPYMILSRKRTRNLDLEAITLPPDQMAARQILRKCIEEGLRQGLGESGLAVISSLRPIDSSAEDPRRLHELLVGIFKEEGALIIEAKIAHVLLDKLGSGDRLAATRSSLVGHG